MCVRVQTCVYVLAESFGLVMNQLVADLSSQKNLNQPCSELLLLPPFCHQNDLLLIGPALQQVEHHYIEEAEVRKSNSLTHQGRVR